MILQGEVKSISMMKPKGDKQNEGLLEYIEDIVGTNYLIEPIEESEKKLDVLVEERQRKIFGVRTIEAEKNGLESAKSEAEMYIQQEKNVMMLKWKRAVYKLGLEKQKHAQIAEQHEAKKQELEEINRDTKEKSKAIKEKNRVLEKRRDEYAEAREEIGALESELKKAEDKDTTLKKQEKDTEKKQRDMDAEMNSYFSTHPYKGDPAKII